MAIPDPNINAADTSFVLYSTALVMIMIPGVGYFYGGNSRNKDKLSVLLSSLLAAAVISIEWFLWGYSLAFSQTGGKFIGDLNHIVLSGVHDKPCDLAPRIPHNTFMIYQNMFAAVTAALAFGSVTERTSLRGYVVFLFFWSVFVYDIVAYWVWSKHGWLKELGALDYAGGTPVHIVSGFSALAYALVVGPRIGFKQKEFHPVNLSDVFIGTALLWFGWFGFNGGSELAVNSRAANAYVVTNLSAALAGLCWLLMDMVLKRSRKVSLSGFCNGAISGLVCITPAAGYVSAPSSLVFGALAGFICCASTRIKKFKWIPVDDACDVFAVHAVGGILGGLLTGLFADRKIAMMSGGDPIDGGWINNNYIQLLYQLIGVSVGAGWSFVVSLIIIKILDFIPFLNLRLSPKQEELGTDLSELSEKSFGIDLSDLNEHFRNFQRTTNVNTNQYAPNPNPYNIFPAYGPRYPMLYAPYRAS